MERQVFIVEVKSVDQLKRRITQAVETVSPAMLINTWGEIRKRLVKLRRIKGGHMPRRDQ